jgi:chemotaxis protein MotA
VEIAQKARRGGILSIEKDMKESRDPFMKVSLRMLIDNVNPHVIQETLEHEIRFMTQRHKSVINFWTTLAAFAPTFGLIGTVLGLVIVLSDLSAIDKLGKMMGAAIIATFYGLYFANFLLAPIGMKLNAHNDSEVLFKNAIIEGILSIAAGDVPYVTRTKLEAFLDNRTKMLSEARKAAAPAGAKSVPA